MKFMPAQVAFFLQSRTARRDLKALRRLVLFGLGMIAVYSVAFHFLMAAEGQEHSWVTGLYWTLTVMSTLGFGDITFQSDAGRVFSLLVLISGVMFLLVVLPFSFIQFFYAPWLEAQSRLRAPRDVPAGTRGHVIVTEYDPVAISLIERLRYHGRPYFVIEPDVNRALELFDRGVQVVVGERDDIQTYERLRAKDAAMVVATADDFVNTNTSFTVRELTMQVPIVSVARAPESVDVLELAGSNHVIHLPELLGQALARRAMGGDVRANVIGQFGDVLIAEAPLLGTPWVGKRLVDSNLRKATGLTVVGTWERGVFEIPGPETLLQATTVLLLAGGEEQLAKFTELTAIYCSTDAPVIILGGGRVGRAAAEALQTRGIDYRIVERDAARVRDPDRYIVGNAADLECLRAAGIDDAPTAMVTTNDDATNIYLTIYCRRLRPNVQIISRATLERNVSTLHRAGADFVMSYASMGASAVFNVLEQNDVLMLAEGLDVFRHPVPPELAGTALAATGIREATECNVIAVEHSGRSIINPPPDHVLPADAELILIGTTAGEQRFLERFG